MVGSEEVGEEYFSLFVTLFDHTNALICCWLRCLHISCLSKCIVDSVVVNYYL